MADQSYLAIDLGAESGRAILGSLSGDRLLLEEIHRFPNGPVRAGNHLYWDVLRLWNEIQTGLTLAAKKFGKRIVSVSCKVSGDLAIHGITGPLTVDVEFFGPVKSPFGETTMGFAGKAVINREDFGLTWNMPLDLPPLNRSRYNVVFGLNQRKGRKYVQEAFHT